MVAICAPVSSKTSVCEVPEGVPNVNTPTGDVTDTLVLWVMYILILLTRSALSNEIYF